MESHRSRRCRPPIPPDGNPHRWRIAIDGADWSLARDDEIVARTRASGSIVGAPGGWLTLGGTAFELSRLQWTANGEDVTLPAGAASAGDVIRRIARRAADVAETASTTPFETETRAVLRASGWINDLRPARGADVPETVRRAGVGGGDGCLASRLRVAAGGRVDLGPRAGAEPSVRERVARASAEPAADAHVRLHARAAPDGWSPTGCAREVRAGRRRVVDEAKPPGRAAQVLRGQTRRGRSVVPVHP